MYKIFKENLIAQLTNANKKIRFTPLPACRTERILC